MTSVRLFQVSGKLRVISAGKDQSVRLWDAHSLRELARGQHQKQVNSLTVGPDWLAGAGDDSEIRVWS